MSAIDLATSRIKGQEVLINLSKNLPADRTKAENYKQLVDTFHKNLEEFQKNLSRISENDCYYDSDAHMLGTSETETFHKVSKANCLTDYTIYAIHQFVKSLIPLCIKEEGQEPVVQFLSDKFRTASNYQAEIFSMLRNQIPLGLYGQSKELLIEKKEDLLKKLDETKQIENEISLNWKKDLDVIIEKLKELENQMALKSQMIAKNQKDQTQPLNEALGAITTLMIDLKKIENFEGLKAKRIATRGINTGIKGSDPSIPRELNSLISNFNNDFVDFMSKNFPSKLAKKQIIHMELARIDRMLNSQIMPLTPLKTLKEQQPVIINFPPPPEAIILSKINPELITVTPKLLDVGEISIKKVSCCNRFFNFFKSIFAYLGSCFYKKSKKVVQT